MSSTAIFRASHLTDVGYESRAAQEFSGIQDEQPGRHGRRTAHLLRPQIAHIHIRGVRGPVPGSLMSRTWQSFSQVNA
jgi:hypothetical protein